jgi:hypothetical protein
MSRVEDWTRCVENCGTQSKVLTLLHIKKTEPKLLSAVLKALKLSTALDVVNFLGAEK